MLVSGGVLALTPVVDSVPEAWRRDPRTQIGHAMAPRRTFSAQLGACLVPRSVQPLWSRQPAARTPRETVGRRGCRR